MASKINFPKIKPFNNKSQVTIFIILGLIIVVIVILFFLLRAPPTVRTFNEDEPQAYIESCPREAVEKAINLTSTHGGDIEPKGFINYLSQDITYLCYQNKFYDPCINQRPLLIEHLEKEITNYISPIVERCFNELKRNFEKRYNVEMESQMQLTTDLQSKNINIKINRDFKATRGEISQDFKKFEMNLKSPLYNFAEIAMEIVNQETHFCNFDVIGYMFLHPEYDVIKFITGDSDIIYVITERSTDQKFNFAVRGCVMPPSF